MTDETAETKARQEGWIQLSVRMPPEVHARIRERTAKSRGSINQQIVVLLEKALSTEGPLAEVSTKASPTEAREEVNHGSAEEPLRPEVTRAGGKPPASGPRTKKAKKEEGESMPGKAFVSICSSDELPKQS